jgi:SAM-dependent methyltransferase
MELEEYDRLYALEDEHWRFTALRAVLRRVLERSARPGAGRARPRVLDAGCGCGGTTRSLGAAADVTGVDWHPRALAWAARRDLRALVRAGVEALPFADGVFDAVVSVDVLYHRAVRDDAAALAELARVCRAGGCVVLWLPAYEWLRGAHDTAVHTERRYTRGRLRALARAAGLVPEHLGYAHALALPAVAARRAFQPVAPEPHSDLARTPPWIARTLDALLRVEGALALRVPLPFGVSLLAVLRKPDDVTPPPGSAGDRPGAVRD